MDLRVLPSALKHGLTVDDIEHAVRNAVAMAVLEYAGEERLLVIGPATDGQLLELVAVPGQAPDRVIHADYLRPKFHEYLRWQP